MGPDGVSRRPTNRPRRGSEQTRRQGKRIGFPVRLPYRQSHRRCYLLRICTVSLPWMPGTCHGPVPVVAVPFELTTIPALPK